jgi:hypothetical protein
VAEPDWKNLDREMTLLSVSRAGVDFGASKIFHKCPSRSRAGRRWGVVRAKWRARRRFSLLTAGLSQRREIAASGPRVSLLEQHRVSAGVGGLGAAAGPFANLLCSSAI